MNDIQETSNKPLPHEGINSYGMSHKVTMAKEVDPVELRNFIQDLLLTLSQTLIDNGVIDIGHVKAHIEAEGQYYYGSVVGEGAEATVNGQDGEPVGKMVVTVNSVVFGIEKEKVKELTESSLDQVLDKFNYTKELA